MLQQLEYLVALSREEHFGRAAATCHVSQPALSAGLRRLERELGVTIVQRTRRFEGFTTEGARVVTWAHRILAERQEMLADVGRVRGRLTATARFGVIPTAVAATPWITDRFRAEHPAASLQILTLPSREISRLLTEFEIDAGLTYLSDETPPGTGRLELYRERYFLLCAADHDLAGRSVVAWADAARLPLCALTSDMRNRRILDAAMAAHRATFHPVLEANTVGALHVHLGRSGMAAIVAHPWLVAFGIPAGMTAVPMQATHLPSTVGLITADRSRTSVLSDALMAAAQAADLARRIDADVDALLTGAGP